VGDAAGAGCAEVADVAVLPGVAEEEEEGGAAAAEGAAEFEGAVALCACGCDACSGVDDLLLHPVLMSSAAGRKREAASVILVDIDTP